ncbi:putative UPF0481 protein At3g02645 [Cajanus cajan]|uniref:UPF0481 protein At3g47200 family n=1 Tax=Cajanus cajan TaxID=3821 RepID=A0A151RE85_CAJCA|nr:putative UPF0481 protein At3g02645 [Cajanus cajan]KYP40789.1 UPF0481 protein At3g47200 family [Cajanus cajan]
MACRNLLRFSHHNLNTRKFHATANKLTSNWKHHMKKELESGKPEESNNHICIYKVPSNMRMVEPKAYRPNNISIGPYHHGSPHVRNMEALKTNFYRRLFNSNNGAILDEAFKFLEEQESDIRRCYMEDIKLSSDEFLQMMLIDASFIIQLLRDLSACEFKQVPCLNRWMLPIIRRELIMLENQLPMFVLNKLFELTRVDDATSSQPCMNLKALAVRFFYPLLHVDSDNFPAECDELRGLHFLDLLRSSIRPKLEGEKPRGAQHHMVRSVTELMEAGVRIKADESRQLLDITFGNKLGLIIKQLTIPPLYINDHRGTAFRNIVAFEKCHKECNPDVTTYLFFFNGLINSSNDVSHLHYKGVLHHSLGNDNTVSELINNITKEIVRDKEESYLYNVVNDANSYFASIRARIRASLVHHYLTSWVVGISTIGALLALYFTFIQTVFSFADALEALENKRFRRLVVDAFCIPFRGTHSITKEGENSDSEDAATN